MAKAPVRGILNGMNSRGPHLISRRLRLRQLAGSFMLLVFAMGALVLPAIHEISGADQKLSHQPDSCQICQIAHLPKDVAVVDAGLVLVPVPASGPVQIFLSVPLLSFQRDPTQARAPPAV